MCSCSLRAAPSTRRTNGRETNSSSSSSSSYRKNYRNSSHRRSSNTSNTSGTSNSSGTRDDVSLELEDYYHLIDMEIQKANEVSTEEDEDLFAQLAQKERDLILAAELGKALLEKNDDLRRKNETLVEEYTLKIEELEQERHALRLRLESLEAEYENTVKELQDDVNQLRQDLQGQQQQLTAGDKDKVNIIRELTQQNERLSDQVQHAAEIEGQLVSEVEGLRSQVSLRMSMPDQLDQLDSLHAKINELNEKKCEVERKIHVLTEERDSYACSLEESQERILMLEKQKLEQELHIRNQGREIYELQEVNHQLQAQIDNLAQRTSYSNSGPPTQTLFNELSSLSVGSDKDSSVISTQPEVLTNLTPQSMMMMNMTFEDDIECDDECSPIPLANSTMATNAQSHHTAGTPHPNLSDEFLNEILDVYNLLHKLCSRLRSNKQMKAIGCIGGGSDGDSVDPTEDNCNSINDLKAGQLRSLLHDLQHLIHDQLYLGKYKDGSKAAEGEPDEGGKVNLMTEQIHDLHVELNSVRTHIAGLHADLQLRDQQLQQKVTEVAELNSKIDAQQADLFRLREYCDNLENKTLDLSRDEIVEQTRQDRNTAMETKVQIEKELYQAKVEIMSLNNQLMAAIHQKVMVSQQRDQWQNDMEDLIDIQMRKRLIQETRNELAEERMKETKVKRTSSFFSRVKH